MLILSNMNIISYLLLFLVGSYCSCYYGYSRSKWFTCINVTRILLSSNYLIKEYNKFKNLGSNILILGVFGIGVLLGIVLISKLIEFLFNKYEAKTYFGVLGFIIASIIAIPISAMLKSRFKS